MTMYCVRVPLDDPGIPGEIVGIYSVNNKQELIDLVDECCDPFGLEFAKMPSGGIMWTARGPVATDLYRASPEDDSKVIATLSSSDFTLTWDWEGCFEKLKFKPLFEE